MSQPLMPKKLNLNSFMFKLEGHTRPSRTNTKKDVLFTTGNWNAKVGSQEITWSNRQIWPWSIKRSRSKANRVLPREHTSHSKHPLPITQDNSTYVQPDCQYRNQIDYIICSLRWRSCIQSAKTKQRADCGSDHELLIAKFRQLKKVGKTTRPLRYDLNQIHYNYTVEVTNRFKVLDLIE